MINNEENMGVRAINAEHLSAEGMSAEQTGAWGTNAEGMSAEQTGAYGTNAEHTSAEGMSAEHMDAPREYEEQVQVLDENREGMDISDESRENIGIQNENRKQKNKTNRNGKPKKRSEKTMFIKTFVIVLLLVMIVATPLFAVVDEVLEMRPGDEDNPILRETMDFHYLIPADSPFFDAFIDSNRVNILALGIDRHNLTDMIMLVSFDLDTPALDIISVPRDTFFLGSATRKINAVYRRNPVNSAVAVSEVLMNIPINYYVTLSHQGVANIVDEIGGVSIYVPFHMRYDDPRDTPPLRINIPAGYQLLDGENAVHFLRFRYANPGFRAHTDGDFGRIRLQQEFVRNAIVQSIGLNLPNIIRTTFDEVQSDITVREAIFLANTLVGISSENIRTHQLPLIQRGGHFHPNREAIAEMLIEIYSMEPFEYEGSEDFDDDYSEE